MRGRLRLRPSPLGWLGGVSPPRLSAHVGSLAGSTARRRRASRRDAGAPLQCSHLSVIDLIIIVAYLVAVVGAGAWFGRKQQTTSQYFLVGQNVPWWAISASIVATETSTITFISVPGIAFARGGDFTFLQLVFGYLVGRIAISILFIPSYFK